MPILEIFHMHGMKIIMLAYYFTITMSGKYEVVMHCMPRDCRDPISRIIIIRYKHEFYFQDKKKPVETNFEVPRAVELRFF